MSIFISLPILDLRGQAVGVLVGRTNMRAPTQIMASHAGLGKTGNIFFLSNKYEVLNGVLKGVPSTNLRTNASVEAIAKQSNGSLLCNNEQGIPVVGSYRWIPELIFAIVAEMEQAEAFGPVGYVLTTNIIIAIISAALTLMGVVLTIRTINGPISKLVETAKQVSGGNLSARMEVEQDDELGTLAETINSTTAQMQELVANLEQRVSERTRDLERRTREVQSAAQIARDAPPQHSSRPKACREWTPRLSKPECREGLARLKSEGQIMLPNELFSSREGQKESNQRLEKILRQP